MKSRIFTGTAIGLAVTLSLIAPAFAQTATSTTPGKPINQAARIKMLGTRGEKEIDVRVDSLNKLITRLQALRNISDAQKSTIVGTVQSLITSLTSLKTKIETEESTTTLKDDVQTITQDYRIYALAIPQLNLFAAADRIITIDAMMTTIGAKMQARLAAAPTIANAASLQTTLTDFASKISDSNSQAQAAVSEVSPLSPDQGDKDKMASNTATLKDARAKLKVAQQDLVAARKDMKTIVDALVKYDKSLGTMSASSTSMGATKH